MSFIDGIILRCLGKKAPRHDPRTLFLADFLHPDLPIPPPMRDWAAKLPEDIGMLSNDRIGDCTCASAAHLIQVWTSQVGLITMPTEGEVIQAYRAVGGYDPSHPETDQGANMLDVLNYWRKTGIGGHKIGAYVKLDHRDEEHVKSAISLFGGVYVGASLPITAQSQIWLMRGRVPTTDDEQPGSWGGHCMSVASYDRSNVKFLTWGRRQTGDWSWWRAYVDECYAVVSQEWLDDFGTAPSGLNMARLLTALEDIK